jgi:hypothetical protein
MNYTPVIIIAAGRSGTNMLRDILLKVPGFATWPCDEINYIWRYGNRAMVTDEFEVEHARPEVCRYIRREFDKIAVSTKAQWVIEKTCANSLRVGFVDRVIPEAKFIFLVRDGRDVMASAYERWRGSVKLRYLLAKSKYVPRGDLPYYAWRYFRSRVYRLFSAENQVRSWGPRFSGIDDLTRECSLSEVCAEQWERCVLASEEALGQIAPDRVFQLSYEGFVKEPASQFNAICSFLGASVEPDVCETLSTGISKKSVGTWQDRLPEADKACYRVEKTLRRLGYT